MRKILIWMVFALSHFAVAGPAAACRVFLEPSERLAMGHERKIISAAAIVKIERAVYTRKSISDAHQWRADGKIVKALLGTFDTPLVQFQRGFGSSACDDGRKVAKKGELWIVYFWTPPGQAKMVWMSYPADVAYAADPMIARPPR